MVSGSLEGRVGSFLRGTIAIKFAAIWSWMFASLTSCTCTILAKEEDDSNGTKVSNELGRFFTQIQILFRSNIILLVKILEQTLNSHWVGRILKAQMLMLVRRRPIKWFR